MAAQAAMTAGSNISRDAGKAVKALIWAHIGRQSSLSRPNLPQVVDFL